MPYSHDADMGDRPYKQEGDDGRYNHQQGYAFDARVMVDIQ